VQDLFNRQQTMAVAQAKEDARGATLATTSKRDEVVYRTASLYLEAERAGRMGELARKQTDSLQRVLETVETQVREGRLLPLAGKTSAANLAHARQSAELLADDAATSETALALALGFSAEDRVHPVAETRAAPALPKSEEEAVQAALDANKDLRRLESQVASKQLEMRGVKAQRLPRVDLVAQYSLLAKFNNYAEFFSKFQRNNEQIGMSFQVPLAVGPGVGAQVAQAEADISRLKAELNNARNRIRSDLQQAFRQEGRATLRQVEEARVGENDRWMAFYDAQYSMERARWSVLRLTGDLLAAVEGQ
jgi:outer membrane protein TolC